MCRLLATGFDQGAVAFRRRSFFAHTFCAKRKSRGRSRSRRRRPLEKLIRNQLVAVRSAPFETPTQGGDAVKVINHNGDGGSQIRGGSSPPSGSCGVI